MWVSSLPADGHNLAVTPGKVVDDNMQRKGGGHEND
jgi:hypothetical protein